MLCPWKAVVENGIAVVVIQFDPLYVLLQP